MSKAKKHKVLRRKHRLTAAQRRPQLIDGMTGDEFIARNADPIWLHQNELWELIPDIPAPPWMTDDGSP